ncbi:hypothetical protein SAMN05421805_106151 [Saccharopolyspora antimicrobica]|uniref:Uncharacterized protein n=1 Tax=Saccharopolyspora antimicrobica TaxID=455193 RepID=A0A1I5B7Y3_9PSEU|nr:hypothetical protein [Saccharopolyspora antimicrobica]RKT86498.1 hypothetical protein ATL45_4876 [Saccharopolyspora antimicrobica]SFN70813.1 hypothetical protein SAMN05421805_106151 [Saccharopolyspora antimicrobica]
MTDSDHSTEDSKNDPATRSINGGSGKLRPLLWLVLVISVAGNLVVSATTLDVGVGLGFGLLTAASGIGLIVHHYRNRRRGP